MIGWTIVPQYSGIKMTSSKCEVLLDRIDNNAVQECTLSAFHQLLFDVTVNESLPLHNIVIVAVEKHGIVPLLPEADGHNRGNNGIILTIIPILEEAEIRILNYYCHR